MNQRAGRTQSFVHSTDPAQTIAIPLEGMAVLDVSTIVIYNPNASSVNFKIRLVARGPDDREMTTVHIDSDVAATDSWERSLAKPWHLLAHGTDPMRHDRLELIPDSTPTTPLEVTVYHERAF